MKKLLLLLVLLACPIAFCFGQLSVSGVAGNNDYSAMRAAYDWNPLPLVPLTVTPKFNMYTQQNMDTMYQYGVGATAKVPHYDLLEAGLDAAYTQKANNYSNYYWDAHAALNIENLFFHILPLDALKIGLGYKTTYHSFYNPDYDVTEQDIYTFLYAQKSGFDMNLQYSKAIHFSGDKNGVPLWLDVPGFTAVNQGYLDYALGADVGYTYKIVRPYAGYTYVKIDNAPSTDDARLGIIVSVLMINFNASVEWFDVSKNAGNRQTFYSLTAGVSIL